MMKEEKGFWDVFGDVGDALTTAWDKACETGGHMLAWLFKAVGYGLCLLIAFVLFFWAFNPKFAGISDSAGPWCLIGGSFFLFIPANAARKFYTALRQHNEETARRAKEEEDRKYAAQKAKDEWEADRPRREREAAEKAAAEAAKKAAEDAAYKARIAAENERMRQERLEAERQYQEEIARKKRLQDMKEEEQRLRLLERRKKLEAWERSEALNCEIKEERLRQLRESGMDAATAQREYEREQAAIDKLRRQHGWDEDGNEGGTDVRRLEGGR